MEIAFHIKTFEDIPPPNSFIEHMAGFYGKKFDSITDDYDNLFQYNDRIYIGNEFCIHRLPSAEKFKKLEKKDLKITLLTPPITNNGFQKCERLFDYLANYSETEVVINDWGLLLFIKKNYPKFKLSAGRLLNKGFKDPRFFKSEQNEFLSSSTFDNTNFREKMIEFGISRIEQDLFPYKNFKDFGDVDDLPVSFYFPFGYITTGRVCLSAMLNKKTNQKLRIMEKCKRPCEKRLFELKNASFSFPLFQKGNTIFYLYPKPMLISLMQKAKKENIRMIYQGFCL
jgi:hypothetical protein